MNLILRFYACYDTDLIALYAKGVSIPRFVKMILKDYIDGKDTKYALPVFTTEDMDNFEKLKKNRFANNGSYRARISITDEEIIKMLNSIRPRKKNLFIKTLIRNALEYQTLSPFFNIKNCGNMSLGRTLFDKENNRKSTLPSLPMKYRKNDNILSEIVDQEKLDELRKKKDKTKVSDKADRIKKPSTTASVINMDSHKPEPVPETPAYVIDMDSHKPEPVPEMTETPAFDEEAVDWLNSMTVDY